MAEMIKLSVLEQHIATLFNLCLYEGHIPKCWQVAEVILIFKNQPTHYHYYVNTFQKNYYQQIDTET